MSITITVTGAELQGFSPQAIGDFDNSLSTYKDDLLKEIGRIEAGQRNTSGAPEVTSRMISEAELIFSRGSTYKRKIGWLTFLKVVSALLLFVAGLMADRESLKDFGFLVAFVIIVVLAVVANTALYLKES